MSRKDRGSTSLVALGLVAVAATLVVVVGAAGAVSAAASRAQGAADACALAGALKARDLRALGRPLMEDPCEEAAAVADEWGGVLVTCRVETDGTVTTEVGIRVAGFWIGRSASAGMEGAL